MNTDTTDNQTGGNGAKTAFGDKGVRVNQFSYGHPYAEDIIAEAKDILRKTETGAILVKVQEKRNIPIHVLKGDGESGYNPQSGVIYVPVSSKKTSLDAKTLFLFTKALRALEQEYVGLATPSTSDDVIEYASTLHTKNLDSILYGCKIVMELTNSSLFSDLLEVINKFGYNALYRAYERQASTKELLAIYSGRQ